MGDTTIREESARCHTSSSGNTSWGDGCNAVVSSTHTFILYLSDCTSGGETCLLHSLPGRHFKLTPEVNMLAEIKPKLGRLLVFPHICPHSGVTVTEVPKLLLRGEMI